MFGRSKPPAQHPPGPTNYLRWIGLTYGHVLRMWYDPVWYATRVAHRYGKLSSFLMLSKRVYIVNSPQLLHEYLVHRRDDYQKARWQIRVLRPILGNGLLTSEGELWLRQRRLLQQAFRGPAKERFAQLAVQVAGEMANRWQRAGQVDLVHEMAALTMDLSIRSTVGINPTQPGQPTPAELGQAILQGANILKRDMENPFTPPDWAPTKVRRQKRQAVRTINQYVDHAIALRRAQPVEQQDDDLLSLLLRSVDHEGDGSGMSDQQARDEVVTMMIAGNHAAGATLGWLWKLVMGRPEVMARLQEEADRVLGSRQAIFADAARLDYTRRVLQETLRLFPAAWVLFCRESTRPTTLGGYRLRRSAWVFAYPWVTHRDPSYFPDPLRFDPERFSPERIDEIPDGAYFPFGHGPRNCIGQHTAMLQLTLATATLVQQCEFTPSEGCDDLTPHRELSLRPATPCWVQVRAKSATSTPAKVMTALR